MVEEERAKKYGKIEYIMEYIMEYKYRINKQNKENVDKVIEYNLIVYTGIRLEQDPYFIALSDCPQLQLLSISQVLLLVTTV